MLTAYTPCNQLNKEGKGRECIVFYFTFIKKSLWKKSEETINSGYQLDRGGPGQMKDRDTQQIPFFSYQCICWNFSIMAVLTALLKFNGHTLGR